jgi:hypothetical protein
MLLDQVKDVNEALLSLDLDKVPTEFHLPIFHTISTFEMLSQVASLIDQESHDVR